MSTQTSNLNLVKQANNENWSNDIHNANLEKIDEFAGEQGVASLSTVADVTALGNALLTFGQSMGAECRRIAITFSVASGIFGATRYIGEIRRIFSDVERYRVTLYRNNSSDVVEGTYNGSAWTWALATGSILYTSGVATPGSGISISMQHACVSGNVATVRIVCTKTDGTVFSGRTDTMFQLATPYIPKTPLCILCVTSATPGSYMTGYALAYVNAAGIVAVDHVVSNQKAVEFVATYVI